MAHIAERLKRWRKAHKLSRKAAAKVLGLNWRTLEGYEQGRRAITGLAADGLLARIKKAEKGSKHA